MDWFVILKPSQIEAYIKAGGRQVSKSQVQVRCTVQITCHFQEDWGEWGWMTRRGRKQRGRIPRSKRSTQNYILIFGRLKKRGPLIVRDSGNRRSMQSYILTYYSFKRVLGLPLLVLGSQQRAHNFCIPGTPLRWRSCALLWAEIPMVNEPVRLGKIIYVGSRFDLETLTFTSQLSFWFYVFSICLCMVWFLRWSSVCRRRCVLYIVMPLIKILLLL